MIFSQQVPQPSPATVPSAKYSQLPSASASLPLVLWDRLDTDPVVWDEIEAMDIGCDFVGGCDDCVRLLDLYPETMVVEMALEPIIFMIAIRQETEIADFHDPVSRLVTIHPRRLLTFLSSFTCHID